MTDSNGHKWYVIQTKPMSEERTCLQFKYMDDPRFVSENVETFCPKIRSMSVGSGDKMREKPLFPSYIFLKWDLGCPERHHLVRFTRGVNRILGDGEKPVPISDSIVEIIKERVNEDGIIEQKMFKMGDQVKVRRGILRDLVGILERPVSSAGRVDVLLRIFNKNLRAKLKCSEIEKV